MADTTEPGSESEGSDMKDEAVDRAKEASENAWDAVQIILTDPMGGQKEAIDNLGEAGALGAGIVFAVAFALGGFLLSTTTLGSMAGGMTFYIKSLIAAAIPVLGLMAGFYIVALSFDGQTNPASSVFPGGVASIPLTIVFVVASLVGMANIELVAILGFLGACITILLVNAALMDIHELSTRKTVILTPVILLVAGYITKVLATSLLLPGA